MGAISENNERHNIGYEETVNQQRIPSGQGLIGASAYWAQAVTVLLGVVGDANANGTEILEIEIPAGYVFVCSILQYACNEGRQIGVCTVDDTTTLADASRAEKYVFGDNVVGFHAIKSDDQPIFVVDNSGSTVAIDMLIYAPKTVFNIANNPATAYFQAFIGGIMYKGSVAVRGTVQVVSKCR